jgi:hypothetical protein
MQDALFGPSLKISISCGLIVDLTPSSVQADGEVVTQLLTNEIETKRQDLNHF